jgi:hypothetical protein
VMGLLLPHPGAIVAKVQSFGYRPFDHREAAMTLR